MAEQLSEVQARLDSHRELQEIVGAMRALAAARLQEAQASLEGTRAYAQVVGDALTEALALLPEPPARRSADRAGRALVLFTAEHGFTGAFNEPLVELARTAAASGAALFVVGSRGRALIEEAGFEPAWAIDMATHAGAVTETARRLAAALSRRIGAGELGALDLAFSRYAGPGSHALRSFSLLPVDYGEFPPPARAFSPLTNLAPGALIERLVEEHLFAQLAYAAMESFASENGARLAAMHSARTKLDDRLAELRMLERRLRQEQITDELLELATGTEAARSRTTR
jgi:F-type H+-transporting ATPase subunit gamma